MDESLALTILKELTEHGFVFVALKDHEAVSTYLQEKKICFATQRGKYFSRFELLKSTPPEWYDPNHICILTIGPKKK